MKNPKFNIIGIGEILWDIYDNNRKYLGGAPTNFAIHCAQLGNNGIIVSRIGKDELGQEIIKSLIERDVTEKYIQSDPGKRTGTVKVKLDKKGKPQFKCTNNVAFDYLQTEKNLMEFSTQADGILFGTLAQRNKISRTTILNFLSEAKTAFKIYDVNLRGWNKETEEIVINSLALCDAIKLNDSELTILKNVWQPNLDALAFLSYLLTKYHLKLAALTLGENGCILLNRDTTIKTKGLKISAIDTTGCGDAFAAGLMDQYLKNKSLKEISEFSNALGAFVAQYFGATPVYSLEELKTFQRSSIQTTHINLTDI